MFNVSHCPVYFLRGDILFKSKSFLLIGILIYVSTKIAFLFNPVVTFVFKLFFQFLHQTFFLFTKTCCYIFNFKRKAPKITAILIIYLVFIELFGLLIGT